MASFFQSKSTHSKNFQSKSTHVKIFPNWSTWHPKYTNSTTVRTQFWATKSTMMATAWWATTTMTMATAQWDTSMTMMATDININDDKVNDSSFMTSDEGDNCNRNNSKDTCALTATTPAHWQWQQHSQSWGGGGLRGRGGAKRCDVTTSWHEWSDGIEDGRVRRLRDKRWPEVEARDNRQCDNQSANERQTGGEAPADKRQWGLDRPRLPVERWRQSGEDERQRHQPDNQPANERRPWRQQKRRRQRWRQEMAHAAITGLGSNRPGPRGWGHSRAHWGRCRWRQQRYRHCRQRNSCGGGQGNKLILSCICCWHDNVYGCTDNDNAPDGKSHKCIGGGCDRGCTGWGIAPRWHWGGSRQCDDCREWYEKFVRDISHGACLPFWMITCMLVSAVVIRCIDG